MFQLGENIVHACKLSQAAYTSNVRMLRKRLASCRGVNKVRRQRQAVASDVEPSSSDSDTNVDVDDNSDTVIYRRKKNMSSNIFKYFMHASLEQQVELQLNVSEAVQLRWRDMEAAQTVKKFDDLGDALLHALNEILCGRSNYRPLMPSTPSMHVNRSVVVTVFQSKVYWIVLHCMWNAFFLENIAVSNSHLPENQTYASHNTVDLITSALDASLRQALVELNATDLYSGVDHIKIIIKQLRGYEQHSLTNKAAGALTSATVVAMKRICDAAAGSDSFVYDRTTKQDGWIYVRTLQSGKKLQIMRSTGKHTNSILAFLEWAKENIPDYVKHRPLHMDQEGKLKFFTALERLSLLETDCHQMEMLRISDHVVQLLSSKQFCDQLSRSMLADLILIGLNKNGQYVSALASTYRKNASKGNK